MLLLVYVLTNRKSRSATARLSIRRFVVFFICGVRYTCKCQLSWIVEVSFRMTDNRSDIPFKK